MMVKIFLIVFSVSSWILTGLYGIFRWFNTVTAYLFGENETLFR